MTNLVKQFDQNGIWTMSGSSTIDFRKLKIFDQNGKKNLTKMVKKFDQNGIGTMSGSSTIDFRKLKILTNLVKNLTKMA